MDAHGELLALDQCPSLGEEWQALERIADGSPFTSWAWVSTWLRHLPNRFVPTVFRARDDRGVVALALLVDSPEQGLRRLLGARSIHLQETGDLDLDELTIEYAGVLARPGSERLAYALLFEALDACNLHWRRLRISASAHATAIASALPRRLRAWSTHASASCLIDLAALRANGGDYLAMLGKATRTRLRQTRRYYEALGPLRIDDAANADEALEWLDELSRLHGCYWRSRGKAGSFASPFFAGFHRDFVTHRGAGCRARLLRVSAGARVVGYLYLLVWRRRAYVYNTGLDYAVLGHHDRPGFLAHLLAIERCLAEDFDEYDFLAGDSDYKRKMATHGRLLQWIDVCRDDWRLAGERVAATLLGRARPRPLDHTAGPRPQPLRAEA